MGVFEFIFFTSLVLVGGVVSIPLYAMRRGYNQSDEKLEIKKMIEQRKLEQVKQDNYLLENKVMALELEKVKKERELREQKALDAKENRRWLIEDKKEEEEVEKGI
ncbi:hypothetical protein GCM10007275_11540 [Jeotgalicoccus coquinae]|uniref:Uncharacterized protein n=1 Tax=Jeotgalicoccus coquinae TaxID=709509 RepID=A0A6V7RNR3_9STAP|nr:hypothetical protein [Jeotgalicoccus coquinae]MBB6422178.1 hypothetical protein [Jeotgalicoccus coquinae]GGE18022.1 hypothetical protein GCM10007275_11540 [Jeotgalicoccus coquinae]CAD2079398.1 hypothetical protein JEOCOQ751_01477 [Jeotgalicoccus coquinae]